MYEWNSIELPANMLSSCNATDENLPSNMLSRCSPTDEPKYPGLKTQPSFKMDKNCDCHHTKITSIRAPSVLSNLFVFWQLFVTGLSYSHVLSFPQLFFST